MLKQVDKSNTKETEDKKISSLTKKYPQFWALNIQKERSNLDVISGHQLKVTPN